VTQAKVSRSAAKAKSSLTRNALYQFGGASCGADCTGANDRGLVSRLAIHTLDGLGPAYASPVWLPTRSTNTTIRAQVSTRERGLSRLVLA